MRRSPHIIAIISTSTVIAVVLPLGEDIPTNGSNTSGPEDPPLALCVRACVPHGTNTRTTAGVAAQTDAARRALTIRRTALRGAWRRTAETDFVAGDVGAADAVRVGVASAGFVGSTSAWVGAGEGAWSLGACECVRGDCVGVG